MKILYAGTINLSVEKGDSLHFAQLAAAFRRRGHEITVLARGRRLHNSFHTLNARLIPHFPRSRWSLRLNDFLIQKVLAAYLRSGKFDILYHRGIPGANRLAKQKMIPVIVEVNGLRTDELSLETRNTQLINYHQRREAQIVRDADKVICVTQGIQDQLIQRYDVAPGKCLVIPNAADTHLFCPMPKQQCQKELGVAPNAYNIGFVGAFQHWVDFETLLQSLTILVELSIPVYCTFVGDGPKLQNVSDRAQALRLQQYIRFVGRVRHKDVPRWMNAFDVCVAPFTRSRNEQIGVSPLKLFEYMACQRPIVATALPGIAEVVENANAGLLCAIENPDSLADQLITLYKNSNLRKEAGRNGHKYVSQNHSWDHIAGQIELIMHETIHGKRR